MSETSITQIALSPAGTERRALFVGHDGATWTERLIGIAVVETVRAFGETETSLEWVCDGAADGRPCVAEKFDDDGGWKLVRILAPGESAEDYAAAVEASLKFLHSLTARRAAR